MKTTSKPTLWRRCLAALAMLLGIHRWYLATGCLHGNHAHCRSTVAASGHPKRPGTCKFCPAVCICQCHRRTKREATE